jgi:hypothetical protein
MNATTIRVVFILTPVGYGATMQLAASTPNTLNDVETPSRLRFRRQPNGVEDLEAPSILYPGKGLLEGTSGEGIGCIET